MNFRKKIKILFLGLKYLKTYILAQFILFFCYDKTLFVCGKFFKSGRFGSFTATGWTWVVNDYFSCKRFRVNQDIRFFVKVCGEKHVKQNLN